jgi:hypothetical protein
VRAEPVEEASDARRAPDRHNRDAFGGKVPTAALSQSFEGELVAYTFNEYDPTR